MHTHTHTHTHTRTYTLTQELPERLVGVARFDKIDIEVASGLVSLFFCFESLKYIFVYPPVCFGSLVPGPTSPTPFPGTRGPVWR